jgi:lipopolysaccharide/colanic/teichoic acid biosynthesis glycosyltransferase
LIAKRLLDLIVSAIGIVMLAPLALIISIAIKIDSEGPVLFRQARVGQFGKIFRIRKFRTMVTKAESMGSLITTGDDPRITAIGAFLRRYKLDELPQLLDVFVGDMSLVGPRPEVQKYVDFYPAHLKPILLSVKPGITDPASVKFRSENELLTGAENPHDIYIKEILPQKIALHLEYIRDRSLLNDVLIIVKTVKAVAFG